MKQKQKLSYKDQRRLYDKKTSDIVSGMAAVFFIAVTAVYPLFITGTKYSNMTFQKTAFFWILTAAAVAAILFMLAFVKKSFYIKNYYIENEPARKISVPEWALLAFLLFAFISAFAASQNDAKMSEIFNTGAEYVKDVVWLGAPGRYEGFISFLCYGLVFFIIARFYKPKQWHFMILAGSTLLLSLYGVLQFLGIDIFNLFPFTAESPTVRLIDSEGNPLYGPLSAFFRTTLGNINIASAYCTFAVVLFAALFAVSHSKFRIKIFYITASVISFAMLLIARGDASKVAVLGAMVLLIPYWIADRVRLGNILIVLSGWCTVYAGFNAYISALKEQFESGAKEFAPYDRNFLQTYTPVNIKLFVILAVSLVAAGLILLLALKKWFPKTMKITGIIILPAIIAGGLLFVEIIGSRLADQPANIIWQAREILHGRLGDNMGSSRGWIWKRAFSVLFDRPIIGTGPDTFLYALGDELQTEASTAYGIVFDKAHNIFLQIAVCMGIPALLAYVAFAGTLFVSAIKKAFERPVLLAFFACAASYMIQSFFCVEVPITTPLVWIAFGVIAGELWKHKLGINEDI